MPSRTPSGRPHSSVRIGFRSSMRRISISKGRISRSCDPTRSDERSMRSDLWMMIRRNDEWCAHRHEIMPSESLTPAGAWASDEPSSCRRRLQSKKSTRRRGSDEIPSTSSSSEIPSTMPTMKREHMRKSTRAYSSILSMTNGSLPDRGRLALKSLSRCPRNPISSSVRSDEGDSCRQ